MTQEPEIPEPDNWKWIGVAIVTAIVLFALASWVRSLPPSDDYFPAFAALAVIVAGFADAAFLWSWHPCTKGSPRTERRQPDRQDGGASLAPQ